jgi:hypothetical protein
MQRLQVQLLLGLDRHETHPRPLHHFDGFGIQMVTLAGLHVGLQYCAGINRTSCPCARKARPRKCDPLQDSMPINCTSKFAVKASSCLREHFLRITSCQSNPIPPNERLSSLNQFRSREVSWDPPSSNSTTSRIPWRTIPLCGLATSSVGFPRFENSVRELGRFAVGLSSWVLGEADLVQRDQMAPCSFGVRFAVDRSSVISGHVRHTPTVLGWIDFDFSRNLRRCKRHS